MKKIWFFKGNSKAAKLIIGVGIILFLLGFTMTIYQGVFDNNPLAWGNWQFLLYSIQGILFIVLGYIQLRNQRYFIEWDGIEIRLLMPGSKAIDKWMLEEIDLVEIRLYEISLWSHGTQKIIMLKNLEFCELIAIKSLFEEIRNALASKQEIDNRVKESLSL